MASFNPFAWESFFFGKLDRSEAERMLAQCESGTFLIRESCTAQGCFSICVKGVVEHCHHYLVEKLTTQQETGGVPQYKISTHHFADIPSLLNHFRVHLLDPVPIKLIKPLEKPFLEKVMAKYKFEPERISDLPFERGEQLEVLGKPEQRWWLARNCLGETGMIPANRVKPSDDCDDALSVLNPSSTNSSSNGCGSAGNRSSAHSVGDQQIINAEQKTLDKDIATTTLMQRQQQHLRENSWVVVKVGRQPSIYDIDSLPIKQGQFLYLQEILANGMCRGTNESGKVGLFPITYVEAVDIESVESPWNISANTN